MLYAPLEQFPILAIIPVKFFALDFSITNFFLINLLALLTFSERCTGAGFATAASIPGCRCGMSEAVISPQWRQRSFVRT